MKSCNRNDTDINWLVRAGGLCWRTIMKTLKYLPKGEGGTIDLRANSSTGVDQEEVLEGITGYQGARW